MLKREAAITLFTTAFIALALFAADVVRQGIAGNWSAIMQGVINSIIGIVISLVVLVIIGWWLFKDAKRAEDKEDKKHKELLEAINKGTERIIQKIEERNERNNKPK
jgi:uncharacterized membrane protein